MKNYLVQALLALTVGLAGCVNIGGWRTVQGSGNVVTENRQVEAFKRVSVAGSGEITLVQGNQEGLTIEADDNLLPLIESTVRNGRLMIGPRNVNLRPTQTIRYRLQFSNLQEVELSGAVRAVADSIQTDRLDLGISGSGKIAIGRLDAKSLSVGISGSGDVSVAGHVESQDTHISGSGNLRATDLRSARAEVSVSGSGDATVWATESLYASISGSGYVGYRGTPQVDSHVSGSGRIRRVGE